MAAAKTGIFPPSPAPPYARAKRRLPFEELTGDATASLDQEVSYLVNTDDNGGNPYTIILPNGQYPRQMHQFFVPKRNEHLQVSFVITGNFVDFDALFLTNVWAAAVLEWDGTGWHLMGGNADNYTATAQYAAGVRVKEGTLQLRSPDDGLWYDAVPRLVDGAVSMSLEGIGEPDAGGEAIPTGSSVRTKLGVLQLKSPDDGLWYNIVTRVVSGTVALSIEGPGET